MLWDNRHNKLTALTSGLFWISGFHNSRVWEVFIFKNENKKQKCIPQKNIEILLWVLIYHSWDPSNIIK